MKHFVGGFLSGIAVLVLGVMGYLRMGFAEERGDIGPSWWESGLMYSAVHASVRRHAPEQPNPVPPTEENLIAGGKAYHGMLDKSAKDYGNTLYPPVPQLPKVGTEYTEAQIFWVAKHGIRRTGMFANGAFVSDQEIWTMAAFIKRIKDLPPKVQAALAEKKSDTAN